MAEDPGKFEDKESCDWVVGVAEERHQWVISELPLANTLFQNMA